MTNEKEKEWIPIDDFRLITQTSVVTLRTRVRTGKWYDGFVVKRENDNRSLKWTHGCVEDYLYWKKNIKGKRRTKAQMALARLTTQEN